MKVFTLCFIAVFCSGYSYAQQICHSQLTKNTPDSRYQANGSEIKDKQTNLIWQRCCMGEHWQNGQITGIAELMNWDKMNEYINQFKDAGWRLPTRQELENLSFTKKIGYITQKGFDFYEQAEVSFPVHWIEPHKPYGISHRADICILSTSPHGGTSKFMDDSNLVAYLRLVKSVI